jgi:plasmid stabilization system protein ParE
MKKYKIIFSSFALNDFKEAKHWYNTQQKDLGKRLIKDVKETIASIKLNPYHASIKFENIRTTSCKIFPYSLHYEIDEENDLVRVLSIFHFSRKPYWLEDD